MRSFVLVVLLLFLSGCQTALVIISDVVTKDESQAVTTATKLGSDLEARGYKRQANTLQELPKGATYKSEWFNPQQSVFIEVLVTGRELKLRLVPSGATGASRSVAAELKVLLSTRYPDLKVEMIEKPEADFLR